MILQLIALVPGPPAAHVGPCLVLQNCRAGDIHDITCPRMDDLDPTIPIRLNRPNSGPVFTLPLTVTSNFSPWPLRLCQPRSSGRRPAWSWQRAAARLSDIAGGRGARPKVSPWSSSSQRCRWSCRVSACKLDAATAGILTVKPTSFMRHISAFTDTSGPKLVGVADKSDSFGRGPDSKRKIGGCSLYLVT